MNCVICKEEINTNNTVTEAGKKEAQNTGICEVCFDNTTYCMEENLERLDRDVLSLVESHKNLVLAGGSLRKLVDNSDVVADYDLFFVGQPDTSVLDYLKNTCKCIFECPEGGIYSFIRENDNTKIQVICKRSNTSVEDMLSSFDITACCAVYDGQNIYKNRRFVFDVLNKQINLNKIKYPVATMKRISKYIQKGYKLTHSASKMFVNVVRNQEFSEEDLFSHNIRAS